MNEKMLKASREREKKKESGIIIALDFPRTIIETKIL